MSVNATRLRKELTYLPNLFTYGRIFVIPLCVVLMMRADPRSSFLACLIYLLACLTDYFDGWLARRMNLTSLLGQFLDPLADKLLGMATLVSLVHLGRVPAWIVVVLLARETTITGLRSIASAEGLVISAGYAGKMKTAFQMIALGLLIVHYPYRIHFGFMSSDMDLHAIGLPLLYLSMGFSLYSAFEYFRDFFGHLANPEDGTAA